MAKRNRKVKQKKKWTSLEVLFLAVSYTVIIACCIFYGTRLLKYYRMYNPKTETGETIYLFKDTVLFNSPVVYKGTGLYSSSGNYVYKGEDPDNYVLYSGYTWRIIRVNAGGSVVMVLDEDLPVEVMWNSEITTFDKSDIRAYLNDFFLPALDKSCLTEVTECLDKVNDASDITCELYLRENYVSLLNISDYLNSFADEKSYINGDTFWLSSETDEMVWTGEDGYLGLAEPDSLFTYKPVIRLKDTSVIESGSGTIDDPYVVEEESDRLSLGDYVLLDNDLWVIYGMDESGYRLSLTESVVNMPYDYDLDNREGLGFYLNNTYYNSLSYKNLLMKTDWYTGSYLTSYKEVLSESVNCYVGMLNILDYNYIDCEDYFLMTKTEVGNQILINGEFSDSIAGISHNAVPCIYADLDSVTLSGLGTYENPYVLGENK